LIDVLLARNNPWWESDYTAEGLIRRESVISTLRPLLSPRQALFLTGLRRVGKTSLMKLLIADHIANGTADPRDILYVSLDDYQLEKKSVHEIVEEFRRIHRHPFDRPLLLFFDEITYRDRIEVELKSLFDSQPVAICASSSSAPVLRDKKALLTGRGRIVEILPLDFAEYCLFRGIVIKTRDKHLTDAYFEEHLRDGGIPEFVRSGDPEYLRNLVDDIIYKDIAAMHGIRNIQQLKEMFLLLMERAGKQVSINKVATILGIAPDTAKRYLDLFTRTYLVHVIPRHGKTNEQLLAPKKIYAGDIGVRCYATGLRDKGSLFENYVYLKLRPQKPRYVYEEGVELDFVTERGELIEVKYNAEMNEKQKRLFANFRATKKRVITSVADALSL